MNDQKESAWEYTPEGIHYSMDLVVCMGDGQLRAMVARSLSQLPHDVVDKVIENCYILRADEESGGVYLPNALIKDKTLIIFPDGILMNDDAERIIAHEIAHYILDHVSPLEGLWKIDEADSKYDEQEADAWKLVGQWLDG